MSVILLQPAILLWAEHVTQEISEAARLDDKGKQVVNDGVQELVTHLTPGQVSYTLQLPVKEELQHTAAGVRP